MTQQNIETGTAKAERLNRECHDASLDHFALRQALTIDAAPDIWHLVETGRPHLFSPTTIYLGREDMAAMAASIAAIEHVVSLPGYRELALGRAPAAASREAASRGVFLGYDYHLTPEGPRLIEINTNAGGGMFMAAATRAHRACCGERAPRPDRPPEEAFLEMFREEWRLERGEAPLQTIAIVDDDPQGQFLYPEFLLFADLFRRAGLTAIVCDPAELAMRKGVLMHGETAVDLVYNRVTDFSLADHPALSEAWMSGAAVITPHPRAHALYADKRNLITLTDPTLLESLGVDADTRRMLLATIPRTEAVSPAQADALWARRKQLFFKPAGGFGSKAAYRGDKLTKRVFAEILAGDYVAQALAPPGTRRLGPGPEDELKLDLRHYVYQGKIQLTGARLYQGQTTNFRTPGGGFAPVVAVDGNDTP